MIPIGYSNTVRTLRYLNTPLYFSRATSLEDYSTVSAVHLILNILPGAVTNKPHYVSNIQHAVAVKLSNVTLLAINVHWF